MHSTETVLGLLVGVAAIAWAAARLRVPYPILLVVGGLGISLWPHLPRVALDPDVVFILFLPPLLYTAALETSWRDFKASARPIFMLAIGLVLFTTVAIAGVAHWMLPVLGWASCFALGAIVSPPDAVAAAAITKRLRVPRRVVTILEGESLMNDATALVALQFAVAVAIGTSQFSFSASAYQFVIVSAGGVVVGFFAGMLAIAVRPYLRDESVELLLSLLTPYIAYLPAEWLHVSGVLSCVTCGLYVNRRLPKVTSPQMRLRMASVWEALIFLLNGLVFILIGLQLPAVIERLREQNYTFLGLLLLGAAISVTAIAIRFIWMYPAAYLSRLIPAVRRTDPMPSRGVLFLLGWTGMRGIVSLAAALALPIVPSTGTPFPGRDLILFLTFCVIISTLVIQGLSLPFVIRWLDLPNDDLDVREESLARLEMSHAALARLSALSIINEECAPLVARVRTTYEERLRVLAGQAKILELDHALFAELQGLDEIRGEALEAERLMLVKLRDDDLINDEILRKVQTELDLEESKLARASRESQ